MLAVREAIGEPEPSDAQRDLGGGGGAAPAFLPAPPCPAQGPQPGWESGGLAVVGFVGEGVWMGWRGGAMTRPVGVTPPASKTRSRGHPQPQFQPQQEPPGARGRFPPWGSSWGGGGVSHHLGGGTGEAVTS